MFHHFSTVAEAVRDAAVIYPEAAFTFQDSRGAERAFSFPELESETAKYAAALQAQGARVGDRVGLIITEPERFVMSFFAALRVGLVPTPLYPPLSLSNLDAYIERTRDVLRDAEATLLVASDKLCHLLWSSVDHVPSLRGVVSADMLAQAPDATSHAAPDYPEIKPDDLAFLQYTSGSTSNPKGVMVTHRSLVASCEATLQHGLQLKPLDPIVSWLPLYHDMGLIGFVITPLLNGLSATLIPTLRFVKRPSVWFEAIHNTRARTTFAPNFALALITKRATPAQLERWDLSCLKSVGCGAEPIQPQTVRDFTDLFSTHCKLARSAVTPAYGMAEATLAMTLKPALEETKTLTCEAELFVAEGRVVEIALPEVRDALQTQTQAQTQAQAQAQAQAQTQTQTQAQAQAQAQEVLEWVSCGVPLHGHEMRVVSETGEPLPEGYEGELCFRGPAVTEGYYKRPEATAQAYREGWLHTGDLGFIYEGQTYITGRLKDLIIINGRNIHPQTLEWVAAEVEGVRKGNVVAFSVPNPQGEALIIALETRSAESETLSVAVRDAIQREHSLVVADVVCLAVGSLPKTSSGKLQRRKTRVLYVEGGLEAGASRLANGSADRLTVAKYAVASLWSRAKARLRGVSSSDRS